MFRKEQKKNSSKASNHVLDRIVDDKTDIAQLLAELGDDDEDATVANKVLIAQNKQTQKQVKKEQKEVLDEVSAKTGLLQADIKKIINDAVTNNTDLKTTLQSIGMDAKSASSVIQKLQIINSAQNSGNTAVAQLATKIQDLETMLKSNNVHLDVFKDPDVMNTLINNVDLKPVSQKQYSDLVELVKALNGQTIKDSAGNTVSLEEYIFGPVDVKASKYWKFKDDFMVKINNYQAKIAPNKAKKIALEANIQKLGAPLKTAQAQKNALEDRKTKSTSKIQKLRDRYDELFDNTKKTMTLYMIDLLKKVVEWPTKYAAKYNRIDNEDDDAKEKKLKIFESFRNYLNELNNIPRSGKIGSILYKYIPMVEPATNKKGRLSTKWTDEAGDEQEGSLADYKKYIEPILKSNNTMKKIEADINADMKKQQEYIDVDKANKDLDAFVNDPINVALFGAQNQQLHDDENELFNVNNEITKDEMDEKNVYDVEGLGLPRKKSKRSKLSKLDGIKLEDITKAVYNHIVKKRSDKRRNGNNKYSGFQKRQNGKFTGGILTNKNEVRQRIIDLVGSNSINEGIRMLEVSKDIFTKSEYDQLVKLISGY